MKYVVVDLEMCQVPKFAWDQGKPLRNETIQIGAVLVDENYEIVSTFNTYVKPELGYLDYFISKLTGITKADLMDAPYFEDAIKSFIEWIPEGEVRCVSWSRTDQKQLENEMAKKAIVNSKMNYLLENWIDYQEPVDVKLGMERNVSLEEALIATDIIQNGRAHDGLDDAYNTALLFVKMEKNPDFELNRMYSYAKEEKTDNLSYTLGDLFSSFKLAVG
ncbi:MAG: exonuclease domain-containing protein [Pseudobutyrivibrio sp.]|nr:exonuclease domain-containing protein [Pseudobutyrivibrio sp.]